MLNSRIPTVYNTTLTSANTEYSQALPAGTKKFSFQCRTAYDVRFAMVTGKVAGSVAPYLTMKASAAYESPDSLSSPTDVPITLYFASAQAGVVVEIEVWQ